MHSKNVIRKGPELSDSGKVLIMIHGRGGTAEDILSLGEQLDVKDFTLMAPQATNNSWYPLSFMAPTAANEPWLSSALATIGNLVTELEEKGISKKQIFFLGFSQGACLTLEFVARNANSFGGVIAFTGGLIGDTINRNNYSGDFHDTPIFIGSSNPDPHVPVERVHASTTILREMNASVTERVYPNMGHTINHDEIKLANELILAAKSVSTS